MSRRFAGAQTLAATSNVLTAYPMTLACWFRYELPATLMTMLYVGDGTTSNHFSLRINATNQLVARVASGGTSRDATVTAPITSGVWHHGCGVYASNTSRTCILDGTQIGTNANNNTPAAATATKLGNEAATNFFTGRLADVVMWNVALTNGEVWRLANGEDPRSVRPQSIQHYWPLYGRFGSNASALNEIGYNKVLPMPFGPGNIDLSFSGGNITETEHPPLKYLKQFRKTLAALAAVSPVYFDDQPLRLQQPPLYIPEGIY